jgi:hypothetical protein
MDCAQGMPALRRASFMEGLSRQRKVVWTLVPGMPQRSRTAAAAITWASTTASRRSTVTLALHPAHGALELVGVGDVADLLVVA